ncbi:MAG: ATP-binding cassette domain-containing protein [Dehalococcoidia bacterium]|nr:ATP-binding cassette domain-containing protein [Dehalococcoidia bacterium]
MVARGLTKHFPPDVRAVDGIDLNIGAGKVFGFLGANGSGKTTTIRMLTTLLQPTSGSAQVDGLDVLRQSMEVRRRIGVALQEAGLDLLQTGRELLMLQSRLFGLAGGRLKARVGELLEIVDMTEAADRRIGTYSGGMKRRLDLATALIHDPRILFLDEPTTGLDPISRDAIWRHVRTLNEERGITVFLTTQYLEEADRLAHELAIIDSGKIIAEGSPEEMKASIGADVITVKMPDGGASTEAAAEAAVRGMEGVEDVRSPDGNGTLVIYIKDGARAIAPVVIQLNQAGVEVGEITLARPTLDDVFLQKTGHHLAEAQAAAAREAV